MKLTVMDFINFYDDLLVELGKIIKPEFTYLIDRLRKEDPHDLITTETEFESRIDALIYLWKILVRDFIKSDYFSPN